MNDIAKEFTSHGKKGVADLHRGVSRHTSGFYNVTAWYTVNALIGNIGWQDGLCKATTWNYTGNRPGKPFDVTKQYAGGIKAWGVNIIRHSAVYDQSTLFEGYPARRIWYPFSTDIYQEVIPSIGDQYPYPNAGNRWSAKQIGPMWFMSSTVAAAFRAMPAPTKIIG